ncbi:MAG: right-handed parallel beta-helix repeat-containing protein [FCB group bacterium]|jgi:hypothetical protein|nr:right-handed parallel beta-helix repeat-containing protein [FCB group bacterium]
MKQVAAVALVVALAMGCASLGKRQAGSETVIGPFAARDAAFHQGWIQGRLDEGLGGARVFRFAPGEYVLTDPAGLRVPGGATLLMDGARFLLDETIAADGQAFLLKDASNVTIKGGEIVGRRDKWPDSVNVAGVRAFGGGRNLRIEDLTCRDLSSNAVGVFGASGEAPYRNVSLRGVAGINCCNIYVDYLLPNKGTAPGSEREDQGTVAFYWVDGWSVEGCRFEGSQSDGTHFCHSRNGTFTNSSVIGSRMGGYFLEDCEYVMASGNFMRENGSRGITIERDSRYCTVTNNIVTFSGRDGLWMPDVCGIVVTNNIFKENGRKNDRIRDCEVRLDETPEYETVTAEVRIADNIFYTTEEQTAVVCIGPGVKGFVEENNTFNGPAPRQYSDSRQP